MDAWVTTVPQEQPERRAFETTVLHRQLLVSDMTALHHVSETIAIQDRQAGQQVGAYGSLVAQGDIAFMADLAHARCISLSAAERCRDSSRSRCRCLNCTICLSNTYVH